MKKIIFTLITFAAFLGIVNADSIVDLHKEGSISITLKGETPVINAEIEAIKIGKVSIVNNNLLFEYVDELNDCNYKLSDENIDNLETCIQNKNLRAEIKMVKLNLIIWI